jgi:hypothetical protein
LIFSVQDVLDCKKFKIARKVGLVSPLSGLFLSKIGHFVKKYFSLEKIHHENEKFCTIVAYKSDL